MARIKYENVEDLIVAVETGVLSIDILKKMYYSSAKKNQPRTEVYRQAIYEISLKKLKENWG